MPEIQIPKIEKADLVTPFIEPDGTTIVLQRHEKYSRDKTAENAGSLFPEDAEGARQRDIEFFRDVVAQESDGSEVMVLFVSSDTQYAEKGRRSLETAQIAQDAATEVFTSLGIDPAQRIINFNGDFSVSRTSSTDQDVRTMKGLREPQIFETPDYITHLKEKYGAEDGPGAGLSQAAWAAHESDLEREVREDLGAEGVHDIVDRTKRSIKALERYSRVFHKSNPNKRLVIWATSHYDTISPLVKDATDTSFDEYVPVDYGGGVVMNIAPGSNEVQLEAQSEKVALDLGSSSLKATAR